MLRPWGSRKGAWQPLSGSGAAILIRPGAWQPSAAIRAVPTGAGFVGNPCLFGAFVRHRALGRRGLPRLSGGRGVALCPDPSGARALLALSAWRSYWKAFFPQHIDPTSRRDAQERPPSPAGRGAHHRGSRLAAPPPWRREPTCVNPRREPQPPARGGGAHRVAHERRALDAHRGKELRHVIDAPRPDFGPPPPSVVAVGGPAVGHGGIAEDPPTQVRESPTTIKTRRQGHLALRAPSLTRRTAILRIAV
jgi:hypothetical protein